MLDIKAICNETEKVKAGLIKRNKKDLVNALQQIIQYDNDRKSNILETEKLKAQRNVANQEIGKAKKEGRDASAILAEMGTVSAKIKSLDEAAAQIEEKIKTLQLEFPNIPEDVVPNGTSAQDNKVVKEWGTPTKLDFQPQLHHEMGERLGILDFKKAGEVTGARFTFVKGIAAQLEMALIQFMFNTHIKAGYEAILPPVIVNKDTLTGTGQLPKFADDVFHIEKFGYYLSPTAEVPVTNYFRNELLDEKILPKSFVAYSSCFRSEAGSYGQDTKGLKRQHQFNKVELVKFATAETSQDEHEKMLESAESILQKLKLPYRVMLLCGGDMGFSAKKTYDIEVWSPAQNGYMEISSVSNCGDFQARRANIRYRDSKTGKPQFAHTLNGSGLAVGRTLLAIMENFQTKDGNFEIPEVLKPYMV